MAIKNNIEKINPATIYKIVSSFGTPVIDGYVKVEQILTSSDQEDGGGHYDLIIQNVESKKFYLIQYSDWDMENTDYDYDEDDEDENEEKILGRCDLPDTMVEVYPKQVTVTEYFPVEN